MNYYIDTEFLEGTQKECFPISLFRKETNPTIDLISIGIVSEDGREFYAVSKDFNLKEAWNRFDWKEHKSTHKEDEDKKLVQKVYWIRENVLKPIWRELVKEHNQKVSRLGLTISHKDEIKFNYKDFKSLLNSYGKTNKQIAKEIKEFCYRGCEWNYPNKENEIEFYAYYADYDWVAFCWLFGKMMNLPNGFPKYCNDLKQMLDERVEKMSYPLIGAVSNNFKDKLKAVKKFNDYPKQENEHNAIDDARWNKKLHEFLLKII